MEIRLVISEMKRMIVIMRRGCITQESDWDDEIHL